jgi:hypothetical protein
MHPQREVKSTLLDTAFRVIAPPDAGARPDPEVHHLLVQRIFPKQAEIITSADLTAWIVA